MLKVTSLNQYYGGSHILRNLSFEIPAGKVTALLGRNGVGKSTLLRTLMGIVPESAGSSPMMHLSSVVLPMPFLPMRQVREPAGTSSATSHSVWLPPYD